MVRVSGSISLIALLLGATALGGTVAVAATPPAPHTARLPGFAEELAEARPITTPQDWPAPSRTEALARVGNAPRDHRQAARWTYALALLHAGRAADALGALDVMVQDDPDLGLAANLELARGRALVELGRGADAVQALDLPGLAANPEAAAWRMRAFALIGAPAEALRSMPIAKPALVARSARERAPFLVAAARMALAANRPDAALHWLRFAPRSDPAANLVRGQALLASGKAALAAARFKAAARDGNAEQRAASELGGLETALAEGRLPPAKALPRVQLLAYRWRGGEVEQRALWLSYKLARQTGAQSAAFAAGAALVRYHALGPRLPALLGEVEAMLQATLAPDSPMPLPQAAGLYWDYRDLAPSGAAGDALVWRLADRLQSAALYSRAAELLQHQLFERARDLAQGPLSVRVARLWVLAGKPDKALDAIRGTGAVIYPAAMAIERQKMEAVALFHLRRGEDALALLEDVPAAAALRAELLWKRRDWSQLAAQPLPPPGALSDVRQALLLRHAVALAMLGDEPRLQALGRRYAPAFARLPTARAFELLTAGPAGNGEGLNEALAAMPAVSPAGADADLLEI